MTPSPANTAAHDSAQLIIRTTRDFLKKPDRWLQNAFREPAGGPQTPPQAACLYQALRDAAFRTFGASTKTAHGAAFTAALNRVCTHIRRGAAPAYGLARQPLITAWNDADYRRHQDVLGLLDACLSDPAG